MFAVLPLPEGRDFPAHEVDHERGQSFWHSIPRGCSVHGHRVDDLERATAPAPSLVSPFRLSGISGSRAIEAEPRVSLPLFFPPDGFVRVDDPLMAPAWVLPSERSASEFVAEPSGWKISPGWGRWISC